MKELGFEKFLEEYSVEMALDDFPPILQEKVITLMRKAYIDGFDDAVKQIALQNKK